MSTERNDAPAASAAAGRALARAREEKSLSLQQAEEVTKIRARYLAAFEKGDFDVLPAVYARGSLRTYANLLGLDGEAMARDLKHRQEPAEPQDRSEDSQNADPSTGAPRNGAGGSRRAWIPAGSPFLYLTSGALLVLLAVSALLTLAFTGDPHREVSQVRESTASRTPATEDTGPEDAETGRSYEPLRAEPYKQAGTKGEATEPRKAGQTHDEEEGGKRDGGEGETKRNRGGEDPAAAQESIAETAPAPQPDPVIPEPPPARASASPEAATAPARPTPEPAPEQAPQGTQVPSPGADAGAASPAPSSPPAPQPTVGPPAASASTPSTASATASAVPASAAPTSTEPAPPPAGTAHREGPTEPAGVAEATRGAAGGSVVPEPGVPPEDLADKIVASVEADVYGSAPSQRSEPVRSPAQQTWSASPLGPDGTLDPDEVLSPEEAIGPGGVLGAGAARR